MAEFIEGKTANEVWEKAINLLLNQKFTLNGRTGEVYEVLHTFVSIKDPKQKWVYNRMPPISVGFALAELVWIMNGSNSASIINFWNPSLSKFAGNGEHYHGAYGNRIRSHFGFDQLQKSFEALQNVPESRQVVIQIYDTMIDFPVDAGQPQDTDIPCNICSLLKVRGGELEWSQIMRSNDVLLGMPYNFVQFTSLQEILAGWLGLGVGTYNHFSDSLHLYKRDMSCIAIGEETEIDNVDSLSLHKDESKIIFQEIYKRMKSFANSAITEKMIYSLAQLNSQYNAYNNIMLIIAAYVAQKVHNYELATELVQQCTNSIYRIMWNKWIDK